MRTVVGRDIAEIDGTAIGPATRLDIGIATRVVIMWLPWQHAASRLTQQDSE